MRVMMMAVFGFVVGLVGARADAGHAHPQINKAVAVLHSAIGSSVRGVVTFTRVADGVRVVADLEGLTPGDHGFHIHAFGDCTAADAASAGGHFNPTGHPHAGPEAEQRHMGDLGNLTADAEGKAHYDRVDKHLALDGPYAIIGYGVIVHEKFDDLKTQPTGAAGGRVACGVVGVAKE